MHDARLANLLGSTAVAVNDLLLGGVTGAAGTSTSGAAALVVLATAPGLTITELGRRIGLSQPAATRMVDSLDSRGLIRRRQVSGRWVAVHLTDKGAAAAGEVLAARGEQLAELVADLGERDRADLERVLVTLLGAVYDKIRSADRICRLCDRGACVERAAPCPVGQAERERGTV